MFYRNNIPTKALVRAKTSFCPYLILRESSFVNYERVRLESSPGHTVGVSQLRVTLIILNSCRNVRLHVQRFGRSYLVRISVTGCNWSVCVCDRRCDRRYSMT